MKPARRPTLQWLCMLLALAWAGGCVGLPEVRTGTEDYRIVLRLHDASLAVAAPALLESLSQRAGARLEYRAALDAQRHGLIARGLADRDALAVLLQRLGGDPRVASVDADARRRAY